MTNCDACTLKQEQGDYGKCQECQEARDDYFSDPDNFRDYND